VNALISATAWSDGVIAGRPFQWVVLATSRARGGAKGSVFKSQTRTRAGDADEMRSAVNPPSFPVRAPYAAMKVGNELVWSWGTPQPDVRQPAQTASDWGYPGL